MTFIDLRRPACERAGATATEGWTMTTDIYIDGSGVDRELAEEIADAMIEVAEMLEDDGITRQEVVVGLALALQSLTYKARMN